MGKSNSNECSPQEVIGSPWINKIKYDPYNNPIKPRNELSNKKIPYNMSPDVMVAKKSILDRRPPSFKINNRFIKDPKQTRNGEDIEAANTINKKAKLMSLQERIKILESKCLEKDKEIDQLNKETQQIVKSRDECTR